MTFLLDSVLLGGAAFLAGALNAIAGGGSFFSFPALVFTGVDPVTANATNTVVVWPGAIASTGAYRRELGTRPRLELVLGLVSLLGGVLGALLLLQFREHREVFRGMVPWLLLVTTLLFAFGSRLTAWVRAHTGQAPTAGRTLVLAAGLQLVIATYGGFFGGGMGVMMLAALTLLGLENIHIMNGIKSLLSVLIKGVAVAIFVFSGVVVWPQAVLMTLGAVAGGYVAAHYARKIDPVLVRRGAVLVGFLMTLAFFLRG